MEAVHQSLRGVVVGTIQVLWHIVFVGLLIVVSLVVASLVFFFVISFCVVVVVLFIVLPRVAVAIVLEVNIFDEVFLQ